jgi:hypothetical protein
MYDELFDGYPQESSEASHFFGSRMLKIEPCWSQTATRLFIDNRTVSLF